MATKSQHLKAYRHIPPFLRSLRDEAGLTQRELGKKLRKPQSWVYNCETANCQRALQNQPLMGASKPARVQGS